MPGFPYDAVAVRRTVLIRLGETSVSLSAGAVLTVHHEDRFFGTACVRRSGKDVFGSVPRADYRKKKE